MMAYLPSVAGGSGFRLAMRPAVASVMTGATRPERVAQNARAANSVLSAAAAARDLSLDWVSYTPAYRTNALTGTGLAFARWS